MGQLIIEKLSKRYGSSSMALQEVSLSAPSSGIFALIGRNGAGKTTLVRILATELAPTSGSASINGIDVVREDKRLRERIAIVPQEARTISWMTPKQSTLAYLMWRGFTHSEAKKRAEESLARLKMDKFADTLNRSLSGGTKRKALAAMVLASEADIIFLDEPTTGLDPISRKDFWEILRELARDRFIFLTTHYLEEAEQLADTLGILGEGRLVGVGTVPSIRGRIRYQYSIKLPAKSPVPSIAQGEVTAGRNGEVQILTNEDEAFAISKRLSVEGTRFSIGPVSLDDIFFQLVGESTQGEQEAATLGSEGGGSRVRRSLSSQLAAAILVNAVYEMKNYPIVLVNTVLSPLSFLVVITFVSKGALLGQAIEGGLIMSMFQSGTALQGDISHLKNDFKLQDMLVSSPASPAIYVLGMATSEIIYNSPALAILISLGAIYIHPGAIQALELTSVLLLMFLTSITIGFMFATLSSDIVQSFAFSRLLTTVFTTITPVYYPITYIPLPFRYLAYLSPTTYAAEIMQNVAGYLQLSANAVITDWAILGGLTVILLLVVSRKARWKEA